MNNEQLDDRNEFQSQVIELAQYLKWKVAHYE